MHQIDLSAMRGQSTINDYWCPGAVSTFCPFCTEQVTITLSGLQLDKLRHTIAGFGNCPNCEKLVYFWAINSADAQEQGSKRLEALLMYPPPYRPRQPITGLELLPERLQRAYLDTLNAYNSRIWSAATTCCRRTLEGIVNNLMPGKRGQLAQQLKQLPEAVNLTQPLIMLSDAVRQGGNLGAHFALEGDPDEHTARAALDLIEYLIEYIYTLPGMVAELHQRIAELDTNVGTDADVL